MNIQKITPFLWFDDQAEAAARFYASIFPDSRIRAVARYPEGAPRPAGMVMTVEFELAGQVFTALNGGPEFEFSPAISFAVQCASQAEVDRYWSALVEGGEPQPCGWLRDRYGVSWQIVPTTLLDLLRDEDPARARRAMEAMLGMQRIDVAAIEAAAR